jgi:Beta-lactamase
MNFFYFALMAAALLVHRPADAQDKTAEIDKIFSWVTPNMPGCVAAASQHGKMIVNRAYGLADLERGVPWSTNSLLDVASIRKQFVAASVLLLVEDQRLSLADDVRKHIPELPDYGHTITLDHLLTHTSGLRDWVPLQNWANSNDAVMTLILRQRDLNFAPGEEWSYSNSGYVLLASRAGLFRRRALQCRRSIGRPERIRRTDLRPVHGRQRAAPAGAECTASECRRSRGCDSQQQSGTLLQRANRRADALDRQRWQTGRGRRWSAGRNLRGSVPQSTPLADVPVPGRVRIAFRLAGSVRAEVHGRPDVTLSAGAT